MWLFNHMVILSPLVSELPPQIATLIARRFAVLGEPTRLRLLNVMHERTEVSVTELADAVGGSQANVSKHLGLLLSERMVSRRRDGTRALYRIADPTLMTLCDEVCAGMRDQLHELSSMIDEMVPEPARHR